MAELAKTSLINDANLKHYYKLEDANDSKGTNNLTNTGSVPFNAAKYGNGGDLGTSNTTKWFSRADDNGITGTIDYSISMWVKILTAPASNTHYTFSSVRTPTGSPNRYWDFYYDNNAGTLQISVNSAGTTTAYTVDLGVGIWHHLVITRNISANEQKIYLDGALVATGTNGSGTDPGPTFGMGAESVGGNRPASAILDDYGLFDRVLTAGEVTTLYSDGVPPGKKVIISQQAVNRSNTY